MNLEELEVYQLSMKIGEEIWEITGRWDFFARDTVGRQLVKAIDSIAANISEGYGRYHYKETKNFGYFSRGSLCESKTWITKAYNRQLISNDENTTFMKDLNKLGVKLNNYIKSIGLNKGGSAADIDNK